jgi:fructokinase
MLRQDLSATGVDLSLVQTLPLNTTSAFVDFSGGSPAYAFHNAGTANERFDPATGPCLPASTRWVHVGSVSLIDQPASENIAKFAIAAAGERLLSLDPNVRAGMINDPADWRARLDRLIVAAALVKLSDEDLAYMAGPGGDAAAQAVALQAMGPALVLVSEGARGVWALWSGGETQVPAPKVSVVDTVGAGDTLMGACLAWLVDHGITNRRALDELGQRDIEAMLAFATRAAALNCTQAGCNPPDWQTVVADA